MGEQDVRVALAGAHGHGRWHLRNLQALASRSGIRLVGVCDPRPLGPELAALAGPVPVPVAAELEELLVATRPDVVVVCTPIHTHTDLTLTAIAAGCDVLLEKPPAPSLAELVRLVDGVAASGRSCQVGFQSLGSQAVDAVRSSIAEGTVGRVRGIGAAGVAVRDTSYYDRGAWAGRRQLDGVAVTDGVLTNPFAHSIASALRVDGSEGPGDAGDVGDVEVELYAAHQIEADDTACIRFRTARGTVVCAAATLCGERPNDPYVVVHGERGRITWWYKRDTVLVEGTAAATTYERTDLLENLVAHVADRSVRLLVPPESTWGFMTVLEAIRLAPPCRPVPPAYQRIVEDPGVAPNPGSSTTGGCGCPVRRIVAGVDDAVERAAQELRLFSELDVPWSTP